MGRDGSVLRWGDGQERETRNQGERQLGGLEDHFVKTIHPHVAVTGGSCRREKWVRQGITQ